MTIKTLYENISRIMRTWVDEEIREKTFRNFEVGEKSAINRLQDTVKLQYNIK